MTVSSEQLAATLCNILEGYKKSGRDLQVPHTLVKVAHAQYMRDYSRQRYHIDEGFRAAAIKRASARVQEKRMDPAYRAREAELQRIRRARKREAWKTD